MLVDLKMLQIRQKGKHHPVPEIENHEVTLGAFVDHARFLYTRGLYNR